MCNLVPTQLCGQTVNVAEHKVKKIKKYLEVFPKLKSVDKVYLFGSALETRCNEDSDIDFLLSYNDSKRYIEEKSLTLPELYSEWYEDDALSLPREYNQLILTGAIREALRKGKVIYEKFESCSIPLRDFECLVI